MESSTFHPPDLSFDVVIVGAGINGAAAAWDAASRGLSTLLVDRGDFGGETSAGCFKMIHGGLRYLQHFDFQRLFESMEEQRLLRIQAPHLVYPLPVLVPSYRRLMQRKTTLRAAMVLYEVLAIGRNKGVSLSHVLPRHYAVSKEECLRRAPGISEEGLTGGVVFFDCQMSNCDRLTFSVVRSAVDAGAKAWNYTEVVACRLDENAREQGGNRINRLQLKNCLSGELCEVNARYVVNATGPWNEGFNSLLGTTRSPSSFSKGIQLVVPQIAKSCAIAVESPYRDPAAVVSRGARSYFIQPWRGYSLVGTSDELFHGSPDEFRIDREEVQRFVSEVRAAYNSELLCEEEVLFAFGGLRPLDQGQANGNDGDAKVSRTDEIWDHLEVPLEGVGTIENLLTMNGVKYTTFRAFAERAIDVVCKRLATPRRCRTKEMKLWGCPNETFPSFCARLSERVFDNARLQYLTRNYGGIAEALLRLEAATPELAVRLHGARQPIHHADLIYAVRHEQAQTLTDVVFRRTGLATLGHPGRETVVAAADVVGAELGWTVQKRKEEVAAVESYFLKHGVVDLRSTETRPVFG